MSDWFNIRHADWTDARAISELASILSVARDSNSDSGFIEYPLDISDFRNRIDGNPMSIVACENSRIVGYAFAYNDGFLRYLSSKPNYDEIMKEMDKMGKPFCYFDMLGVHPEFQGVGVGSALYGDIEHLSRRDSNRIYGSIAHRPWRNTKSVSFFQERGWNLIDELQTRNGLVFGRYMKYLEMRSKPFRNALLGA